MPYEDYVNNNSPEAGAALYLERKRLRESLDAWAEWNHLKPAKHHRLINSKLEAVARGDIIRLAIFMPPGSAKSTYASILFPPWALSANPKAQILAASHTTELAERWGRRVRNIIMEQGAALKIKIKDDNQAANRWSLEEGGEYYAAGANVGIAGFRALYGIIDDPIRSRQDADSLLIRNRLWDWYINDFRPRLVPKARQILIQTRFHEDDLAGRILNHEPWEVLSLPAIAKQDDALGRLPGEPLWTDDDYGYGDQLLSLRDTTPPRTWSSLFQQSPAPDEGNFFKDEWLTPCDIVPHASTLRVYGGSDYAVTSDGGDFTVHIVVGIDALNVMYLLDVWRRQVSADVWIEGLCDLVQKYRPLEWAEETGQIRSGIGPFLQKRMTQRHLYVNRHQFPSRADKSVRARSMQGRMALSGLRYPRNAPWVADWRAEILSFPAAKHDDMCVVEGTLISMAYGPAKPIEFVEVGDVVATPAGPWLIEATTITGEAAQVYRVTFADGRTLTATPNHKLFVHGKGLVRVDELSMMDQCVEEAQQLKLPNIKGTDIVDIPTAIASHIAGTSTLPNRVVASFIAICGKMLSGRSRQDTKFITRTVTGAITASTILNVSQCRSTAAGIPWSVKFSNINCGIWRQFATRLRNGIEVMKAVIGIRSLLVEHGLTDRPSSRLVFPAVHSSRQHLSGRNSVLEGAANAVLEVDLQSEEDSSRWVSRSPASVAIDSSLRSGPTLPLTAPRHAGCVIEIEALSERARVRNLTVRRAHVYYANGILSRNCDAMGLVGQLLDKMAVGQALKADAPFVPKDGYKSSRDRIKTIDMMTM